MSIIPQLFMNGIIAGAMYTLMSLSFNVIYKTTKFFNMAHGAIAMIGGYTAYLCARLLSWNVCAAIVIGIFFAGMSGWVTYKAAYLPLRKRSASPMVMFVASLGAYAALQALLTIAFGSQFQILATETSLHTTYHLWGGIITEVQLITLIAGILSMMGLGMLLRSTFFGKTVRAISDDEETAKIAGINTEKIIGCVFFLGSSLAGMSGILAGFDIGIVPALGMSLLLKGIIASIIGGVGNVYGGVMGAFILGFMENFGIWKISGEWKDAIAFTLLLMVLFFKPQGLMRG